MRYEVSVVIRDTPERVWAWWTDYGPVGRRERVWHGFGWTDRIVVAREGDVIDLRETVLGVPVLRHRVELHPARRAFRESSPAFDAWWTFEPHPDGTLVRREVEVHSSSARLAPKGPVLWAARRDLEYHARDYERGHPK